MSGVQASPLTRSFSFVLISVYVLLVLLYGAETWSLTKALAA